MRPHMRRDIECRSLDATAGASPVVVITSGREFGGAFRLGAFAVYETARKFDMFDEESDPWGEHDFSSFEFVRD